MSAHETCQTLLAWYANGTLNEKEMSLCSEHLLECEACQTDLDATVRQMQALNATPTRASVRPSPAALLAAAGAQPRSRQLAKRWPVAFAASMVLVVALAGVLGSQETMYRALTDVSHTQGDYLQVAFQPSAQEADIRRFVLSSGGEVVGNPTPTGIYRLRFDTQITENALAAIRAEPAVIWANVER